jgi:4-amino-4-deoxy-L-arabinose transferase-like glycosyltransferase
MNDVGNTPGRPSARALLLVLAACLAVFWWDLGSAGFTDTEGHRVIPGWEMLDAGQWLLPRMFEQVYVRKPPGMPWAVAVSSSILGQTEFAARAVSAASMTGLALLGAFFAARWFGRGWALAGGLAFALTPRLWSGGRAAEIEALNNFAAAAAVLLILDMLLHRGRRHRAGWTIAGLAAALCVAALAKGPAAMPVVPAAVIASCLVLRSGSPLLRRELWIGLVAPAAVLVPVYMGIKAAVAESGQMPVAQGVSDFLWTGRPLTLWSVGEVAAMPMAALISVLPAGLALLFVWGPDARRESARDENELRIHRLAQGLALTCVLSLLILTILGVRNPRYAQPGLSFVPLLVVYVLRGREMFVPLRRKIAVAASLGRAWVWIIVMVVGLGVFLRAEQQRDAGVHSGRTPGVALGAQLPDGAVVLADDLVEARPEVLLYARRAAAGAGRNVRVRWVPGLDGLVHPPADATHLALRTDAESRELGLLEMLREAGAAEEVTRGRVHKFEFVLLRLIER